MICFRRYEFEVASSSELLYVFTCTFDEVVCEVEGVIVGDIDKDEECAKGGEAADDLEVVARVSGRVPEL